MYIDILDLKRRFENGENIISYIRSINDGTITEAQAIMLSYDIQSSTYIRNVKREPEFNGAYTSEIAKYINNLNITELDSILEVGVGEGTTLANLIPKLQKQPKKRFGFDISWSRVRYAKQYLKEKQLEDTYLFQADLFDIPLSDNSVDLVYTSHSLESNGGKERAALEELFRIARKYIIMVEPSYKIADWKGRRRMRKLKYVKNLDDVSKRLGYDVIVNESFPISANKNNPSGITIIKKTAKSDIDIPNDLICPITKQALKLVKNFYYSEKGGYSYPVLDEIPCLRKEYGILSTHIESSNYEVNL